MQLRVEVLMTDAVILHFIYAFDSSWHDDPQYKLDSFGIISNTIKCAPTWPIGRHIHAGIRKSFILHPETSFFSPVTYRGYYPLILLCIETTQPSIHYAGMMRWCAKFEGLRHMRMSVQVAINHKLISLMGKQTVMRIVMEHLSVKLDKNLNFRQHFSAIAVKFF